MMTTFRDRREAGRRLAEALRPLVEARSPIVLGLPRGGIPVAYEVAVLFHAPLDVFVVRKLGVPGYEELAMGAIASGGIIVTDAATIRGLGITKEQVQAVVERERLELARRERAYRDSRPVEEVRGRTVVLVDDGLATGASMMAGVTALRRREPAEIIVGVPVGAASTCETMRRVADGCVCVMTPEPFGGVGRWYQNFEQTTDDEVRALLAAAAAAQHSGAPQNA